MATIFRDVLVSPQPTRPRHVTDAPPNLLLTTLAAAVIATAPFVPPDLPTARPAARYVADAPPNLLVGELATPFRQTDWPAPKERPKYVPDAPPNLLVGALALPVFPPDLPTPRASARALPDATPNLLVGVLAPAPFVPTDWPTPRQPGRMAPDAPPNLLVGTLYVAPAPPFAPTETALPKAPPTPRYVPDAPPNLQTSVFYVVPPVRLAGVWTEATRGLVWGGPGVLKLIKRLDEVNATYAYDFVNDAAIAAGDSIASVLAVNQTTPGTIGVTPLTLGATSVSGTQVRLTISGGQENVTYQLEFKVLTVGGATRVGLGQMLVQDSY
jgi:hypothetical protein